MNLKTSTLRWSTSPCRFKPEELEDVAQQIKERLLNLLPHISPGQDVEIKIMNRPDSQSNQFGDNITVTMERFEEVRVKL